MATEEVFSNEDLVKEILLRLPVKPLIRCKCVSKRWLAFISEPQFCRSHTLRQYQYASHPFPSAVMFSAMSSFRNPIIPLKSKVSYSQFRYVKVPGSGMSIIIKQSCNGLLLLEGKPLNNRKKVKARYFFVNNPTTNEFVAVNFPSPRFGSSVISLFLSFEPLRSPHYKVVSIRSRNLSKPSLRNYVVNVYSSETGSWSDPGVCFTAPNNSQRVYCNGAVYWYGKNDINIFFDVENQCFKTFPMPLGMNHHQKIRRFGESGGHLYLIVQLLNYWFDILELNEDRSGWSLRFHVNLLPLLVANPMDVTHVVPSNMFCFVRQEREVDSMLMIFKGSRVIAYNLGDSTFEDLSFLIPGGWIAYFDYYENLSWIVRPSNAD